MGESNNIVWASCRSPGAAIRVVDYSSINYNVHAWSISVQKCVPFDVYIISLIFTEAIIIILVPVIFCHQMKCM